MDETAQYGALNAIARHRINTDLISRNWDDMLRVAGSLKIRNRECSYVDASLARRRTPTTIGTAIGEVGRVAKTLYLLAYIDDET